MPQVVQADMSDVCAPDEALERFAQRVGFPNGSIFA